MNTFYKFGRRGGHTSGDIRDALIAGLNRDAPTLAAALGATDNFDGIGGDEVKGMTDEQRARWLVGKLWHCSDTMPRGECRALDLPQGSSYAKVVRQLAGKLEAESVGAKGA